MQQSSTLPNEIVFYFFNYYNNNRTTLLFFKKLFYASLTYITFYKPTTYIKICFINIQSTTNFIEVFYCTSENMKYICNVKQTKSVSLNNKKAGDFKSHLLHISLANVVVSFLLCKIFCGKFKYKIENNMKVTKKDILSIKAGSSKVMQLDSYKDCVNARSYAYQLAFTDPREDVERYSTSIDKDKIR